MLAYAVLIRGRCIAAFNCANHVAAFVNTLPQHDVIDCNVTMEYATFSKLQSCMSPDTKRHETIADVVTDDDDIHEDDCDCVECESERLLVLDDTKTVN